MILVTGGTGLVGSHLLYKLCGEYDTIRATKRATSDVSVVAKVFSYYTCQPEILLKKIEWVEADLSDYFDLRKCFDGVSQVYHCAALISFHKKDKNQTHIHNTQVTANIVNMCLDKNIQKLCHVSSVASLGKNNDETIINEGCEWVDNPENSNYSKSKYLAELEVWRGIEEGLNAVIVNPSIILGPGFWDKGSSSFFKKIDQGMPFYTSGKNGFVDVLDVVSIMIKLMNSEVHSQRFIINGSNTSFKILSEQIALVLGKESPKYLVSELLLGLAWRLSSIYSFFSGKNPMLTKETCLSATKSKLYDNMSIRRLLKYDFRSIEESCLTYGGFYLNDKNTNSSP